MKRIISLAVFVGFLFMAGSVLAADINMSGFGQWWYYYSDAPDPGVSEFRMARLRFKAASQMTEKISFFTQFDFRHPNPSFYLLDAFLDLKMTPWMTMRAGSFSIPFGIGTSTSPFALEAISYDYVTGIGEGTGFFSGCKDVGLQMRGKYDPVNYVVAFMNGTGLGNSDDDKWKNITGRLGFGMEGVNVGASGFYGFTHPSDSSGMMNLDSLWTMLRYGADLKVDIANVLLKGEFVMGSHDVADDSTMSQMGYYASLGYTFPLTELGPKEEGYMAFQPVFRYDAWDRDSDMDDDAINRISAGANFWFDKNAKVSAFYELRNEEIEDGPKDDIFRLQLAYAW
jgi:hypothetical protein